MPSSLGTALVMAGRTEPGLAALDEALALAASGAARGRILVRRGGSLHIAGRYDEARADLRKAITLHRRLRSAGPGPGALAAALRDARADACRATTSDPVVTAAGWSFIALGA